MNPLISIIIPVYNSEQYLHQCIDSVLAQSYTDFELLLINDGSTDFSGSICDEYAAKDSRVKVFHKANGGVSSARNLGIENVNGEWICFVDSDDKILNNYVADLQLQTIENADIIIHGFKKISRLKENLQDCGDWIMEGYIDFKKLFNEFKIIDFGFVVAKLYRSSIIKNNNIFFPEETSHAEDLLFLLDNIFHSKKIISQKKYNYEYFHREDSLTSTFQQPLSYFYQFNFFKKKLKTLFPEIYNDIYLSNCEKYRYTGEIQFVTILKFIKAMYYHKLSKNKRMSLYKKLDTDDKELLNAYKNNVENPILKFAYKNIYKSNYGFADQILYGYYKIVNLIRKR